VQCRDELCNDSLTSASKRRDKATVHRLFRRGGHSPSQMGHPGREPEDSHTRLPVPLR